MAIRPLLRNTSLITLRTAPTFRRSSSSHASGTFTNTMPGRSTGNCVQDALREFLNEFAEKGCILDLALHLTWHIAVRHSRLDVVVRSTLPGRHYEPKGTPLIPRSFAPSSSAIADSTSPVRSQERRSSNPGTSQTLSNISASTTTRSLYLNWSHSSSDPARQKGVGRPSAKTCCNVHCGPTKRPMM